MKEKTLKNIGLNENEIKVYLALLSVGSSPASTVAKRTALNRSTAQYICQQLFKKRLIRMLERGNTYIYTPEPPEKLTYLLEQEKEEINKKENEIEKIIPELKGMMSKEMILPKVKIFDSDEGIIELYEDLINDIKKDPTTKLYGYISLELERSSEKMEEYQWSVYTPMRKKIKNPSWFLFNKNKGTKAYQKIDKEMNRISMFVDQDYFPFNASVQMYNNKVAIYSSQKDAPMGVLIEHNIIYQTHLSIFKVAWEYARQLPENKKYKKETI